jgi:hypothetical protein
MWTQLCGFLSKKDLISEEKEEMKELEDELRKKKNRN